MVPIVVRDDASSEEARRIVDEISGVSWSEFRHAYGSAADVGAQLLALTVGDESTRKVAWWNLWGNIHHQGTAYTATVPAVPIIASLAEWREFPDRVEAIVFLRELGRAQVANDEVPARLSLELAAAIDAAAKPLLNTWRSEPQEVRRALLWLLSSVPLLEDRHRDLLQEELPGRFEQAWFLARSEPQSQREFDQINELEEWVTATDID